MISLVNTNMAFCILQYVIIAWFPLFRTNTWHKEIVRTMGFRAALLKLSPLENKEAIYWTEEEAAMVKNLDGQVYYYFQKTTRVIESDLFMWEIAGVTITGKVNLHFTADLSWAILGCLTTIITYIQQNRRFLMYKWESCRRRYQEDECSDHKCLVIFLAYKFFYHKYRLE